MGLLVGRLLLQHRVPHLGLAQQVQMQRPSPLPGRCCPGLIQILRQQRSAVGSERGGDQRGSGLAKSPFGELAERVVVHACAVQLEQFVPNDQSAGAQRLTGVMRRLVQSRCGGVDAERRPDLFENLLAVQPTARRDREQLDQGRRVPSRPCLDGDRRRVHRDLEAPEKPDVDRHNAADLPVGGQTSRGRKGRVVSTERVDGLARG
jgi:hypothetical protein